MSNVKLAELIQIAGDLVRLKDLMDTEENPREWKKAKEAIPAVEERFKKERTAYVDLVLKDRGDEDPVDATIRELEDFRTKAHPSWQPATDYTADHLIPYLQKESRKSPAQRKALKLMPWIFAAICVIAYFGVRVFSAVDVSAPLASRQGIEQRAAAMEKFVRYDDFMHTEVRKGGWLKGIMFWPIEPTDAEMAAASEFAGLTLGAFEILRSNDQVCGDLAVGQSDTLSKDELEFVDQVAEFVDSDRMKWTDEPELDISTPLRALHPC
jgi:hypothetical protein